MNTFGKIFIFAGLWLSLTGSVFAAANVSLFMESWVKFNSNDPPQTLPTIIVTDNQGGLITAEKGITVMLPKYMDILWERDVTQVGLNGIQATVTYSKNLKNLIIPVSKTFMVGEAVRITGAKVRVYEQGATYQDLELDIDLDGVGDVKGVNGVQIDDTARRNDSLLPYPVTALTSRVDGKTAVLTWENPPDLDYNGILLTRTITRLEAGTTTMTATDITLDRLLTAYTDAGLKAEDSVEYVLKTKDNRGNFGQSVKVGVTIPSDTPISAPEPVIAPVEPEVTISTPTVPTSILDEVLEEDIDAALEAFSDLSRETEGIKEIAYLFKTGIIKASASKKFFPNKSVSYKEFIAILKAAFETQAKGALLTKFKKLKLIPRKATNASKVKKPDASRVLHSLLGFDASSRITGSQNMRGTLKKAELGVWVVKFLDARHGEVP